MTEKPLIVIEHLEDHFSRWLRAEYRHAKSLIGDALVVTNARGFCGEIAEVVGPGNCFRESILDLQGVLYSRPENVIILDLVAENRLKPGDAVTAEAIVVGGILGDHPPRGRTHRLLTRHAMEKGMRAANIGGEQFSIDGAAYIAYLVSRGRRLDDIPVVASPVIEIDLEDGFVREVVLPFAYPADRGGRPLISREVIELLHRGLGYEEYLEARRGLGEAEG